MRHSVRTGAAVGRRDGGAPLARVAWNANVPHRPAVGRRDGGAPLAAFAWSADVAAG
ncbi:MAG TPA: hypothetical protein VH590_05480 [Ktedonobacterales bacterium]